MVAVDSAEFRLVALPVALVLHEAAECAAEAVPAAVVHLAAEEVHVADSQDNINRQKI